MVKRWQEHARTAIAVPKQTYYTILASIDLSRAKRREALASANAALEIMEQIEDRNAETVRQQLERWKQS